MYFFSTGQPTLALPGSYVPPCFACRVTGPLPSQEEQVEHLLLCSADGEPVPRLIWAFVDGFQTATVKATSSA